MSKLYARLDGDMVAEIVGIADDLAIKDCFHPSLVFELCGPSVQVGDVFADGQFSTPAPQPPPSHSRADAHAALSDSDVTVLRCYEAGIPVPAEWRSYRDQLRAIASGTDDTATLPSRPAYPQGS